MRPIALPATFLALFAGGCGSAAGEGAETGGNPDAATFQVPDCYTREKPGTASTYAALIAPELGVVPTVDAAEMVEIPLFQAGRRVYGAFGINELDNPARLGGKDTVSNSALQRYAGIDANGNAMPDVVWVAFRRMAGLDPDALVGSMQLIGYNARTGATAFIESNGQETSNLSPWLTATRREEGDLAVNGRMPGPDDPEQFDLAYQFASDIQCVACHQADPFITSPFITAARVPGTGEPVIPILDASSPYYVMGGHDWDMRTIDIEGNACLGCHRMGMATIDEAFAAGGYDVNDHMPPDDPGSLADDYAALVDAWTVGPENHPDARWVIPPACGTGDGNQVVGDRYPFRQGFNDTGSGSDGRQGESRECPPEFDPAEPCTDGDKCLEGDTWYSCEGGAWLAY